MASNISSERALVLANMLHEHFQSSRADEMTTDMAVRVLQLDDAYSHLADTTCRIYARAGLRRLGQFEGYTFVQGNKSKANRVTYEWPSLRSKADPVDAYADMVASTVAACPNRLFFFDDLLPSVEGFGHKEGTTKFNLHHAIQRVAEANSSMTTITNENGVQALGFLKPATKPELERLFVREVGRKPNPFEGDGMQRTFLNADHGMNAAQIYDVHWARSFRVVDDNGSANVFPDAEGIEFLRRCLDTIERNVLADQ